MLWVLIAGRIDAYLSAPRATAWHEYRPPFWRLIIFKDGTKERGALPVMRRRTLAGHWEYRRYTETELAEWQDQQAL